jgi:hypothetical protein
MLLIIAEELCKMNEFLQKIPHNNIWEYMRIFWGIGKAESLNI